MSDTIPLADILGHPEHNGLYRLREAMTLVEGRHIDGRHLIDKQAMLAALAEVLAFPDYFGFNWDAAEECLTDLNWYEGGVALVIDHAGTPESEAPDDWAVLIDLLIDAAEFWKSVGRPFAVFLCGGHTVFSHVAV